MFRLFPVFMLIFALQSACAQEFQATPVTLADRLGPGDAYAGIRWLGALRLPSTEFGGLKLCGLSGLAWDEDAELLYAISDIGGLFHLRPEFDSLGILTGVRIVAAYPLLDVSDQPVRHPFNDAEGLAIRNGDNRIPGDTELLISFEIRPRVVRYSPTGQWRGEEPLPAPLRDLRNYRDINQALEAVTIDPHWGVLVGTEAPLRGDPAGRIRLFAGDGRYWWNYPLGAAPGSALVAMEALPDGGLLTLERAFVAPLRPLIISLRRTELPAAGGETPLSVTDVAILDSSRGWLLDNFEGLTRYRDRRFFMISDDNCSAWQATLLVHFELPPATPRSGSP
ncbi:MAG: esterase-like activity of phytase family protein [Candidatus Competibacter sp.]|nr:esterase-like activity of phytase family protein [Candidatus Competibacter sp.]MDG4582597.1 esterase-like activity of phytase family protein [Candidatus Competibacter sp.]